MYFKEQYIFSLLLLSFLQLGSFLFSKWLPSSGMILLALMLRVANDPRRIRGIEYLRHYATDNCHLMSCNGYSATKIGINERRSCIRALYFIYWQIITISFILLVFYFQFKIKTRNIDINSDI